MLCKDVKRVVYFFLDGSLTGPAIVDVRSHLTSCPDCEARTRISGRLRILFQKRMERICAPDRLRIRLTRALRALATE